MKVVRKLTVLVFLLGAWTANANASASANAASPLQLAFNGKVVKSDIAPIASKGSVLVPLRTVADALGADLKWEAGSGSVTFSKWSTAVSLTAGSGTAEIAQWSKPAESVKLDVPAKLVSGRMYVPIRFLSQTFGYVVYYSGGTVYIRDPISPSQLETLATGTLEEARQVALKAGVRYAIEPLVPTHWIEYYGYYYLFPEGEALRYLYFADDLVTYFEIKDGFKVAAWQARVSDTDGVNLFLQGKWTEERGTKPDMAGLAYFYYTYGFFGDSNEESYGRIDPDGKLTTLANRLEVGGSTVFDGKMQYALPDEVRMEVIKLR